MVEDRILQGVFFGKPKIEPGQTEASKRVEEDIKRGEKSEHVKISKIAIMLFALGFALMFLLSGPIGMIMMFAAMALFFIDVIQHSF